MVALAIISTNQKATHPKRHNTKQTINQNSTKRGKQTAIDCLNALQNSRVNLNRIFVKDVRTIDNLEIANPSPETSNLNARWGDIVELDIYRRSGDRWKTYHVPKFLRNERRVIEEQLETIQTIHAIQRLEPKKPPQAEGIQPQSRRQQQWTVDPFREIDDPQQSEQDQSGPSTQQNYTPMGEGNRSRKPTETLRSSKYRQ